MGEDSNVNNFKLAKTFVNKKNKEVCKRTGQAYVQHFKMLLFNDIHITTSTLLG